MLEFDVAYSRAVHTKLPSFFSDTKQLIPEGISWNHNNTNRRSIMTSHQSCVDVNNNSKEDNWRLMKPRMESSIQRLKSELAELRQCDKILLKRFIKMRSEIKEMSRDIFSYHSEHL